MALRGRLGRYRLVRRLAVGGMAEVYLAIAEGLSGFEKRVVVKRLLPQHARDAELLAMFLDEARLVATLRHPNIGEVYDVGAEGGEYFFAMEHIAGRDLRDLLVAGAGEPLPLPEALAIVTGVASALHHAHEQRDERGRLLDIVHRDVSPSNVLVSATGQVKLIDFGVAKWTAQRTETRHGVLKGKCAYMSPEQCRAETLDRRSDVFSLGVLLYEVTTGHRPFDGPNDFETMTAIVRGVHEPPSARCLGYPAALEAIVLRALAPRRERRHATALELAGELGSFATAAGLSPAPAGLAALLARLFGDEVTGSVTEQNDGDHETGEPTTAGAELDDLEPARPALALDRTATDLHAAAPLAPAQSRPLAPPSAPRRAAIYAGLAFACAAALFAGQAWRGATPPSSTPPPPAVTAVPAQGTAEASQPSAPAPKSAPVEPAPATVTATAPLPPPSPRVRRVKATKRMAPPAAVAAPAPTVRVWDPDSPVPPPP